MVTTKPVLGPNNELTRLASRILRRAKAEIDTINPEVEWQLLWSLIYEEDGNKHWCVEIDSSVILLQVMQTNEAIYLLWGRRFHDFFCGSLDYISYF